MGRYDCRLIDDCEKKKKATNPMRTVFFFDVFTLQRCHLVAVATAVFIVHRQRMYVLPESAASSFSSFSS